MSKNDSLFPRRRNGGEPLLDLSQMMLLSALRVGPQPTRIVLPAMRFVGYSGDLGCFRVLLASMLARGLVYRDWRAVDPATPEIQTEYLSPTPAGESAFRTTRRWYENLERG